MATSNSKTKTAEAEKPAYSARVRYTREKAEKYQHRSPAKDRKEMRVIERAFKLIPPGRVLDAPCGGGRVARLLAGKGYTMTCGDLSEGMIEVAREKMAEEKLDIPVDRQDLEKLTYGDRHFDAAVCFRVFHHFPNREIRGRVVHELCRVSARHVAISYVSPISLTAWKRRIRKTLLKKPSSKHATSLKEVTGYFEAEGFRLVQDFAQSPVISSLHLAVFERK